MTDDSPGSRTITILFTDIEGSTRLWEQFPEAMDGALLEHDAIVRGAIESGQGRVIKNTGDGFLAVFESAQQAIRAVIAAQKQLIAQPWQETGSIRVRMGLHTGEARGRHGDFYGTAVNRAARLMALAAGEQILLSSTTADLVREMLSQGATLADLGPQTLRGLSRQERVFQLVHPDLPADFPPLGSRRKVPHNLPRFMTSFIGRENESATILDELASANTRLLTLIGPGGVGKTRLSLHIAGQCLNRFSDGVFFVPLAQVRDASLVAPAIMQALEQRSGGSRPPLEELKAHLEESDMMLILDNLEHLPDVGSVVGELLKATLHLKVMATSRSPVGVYGERTFEVLPLAIPEYNDPINYQELIDSPAVTLFLERARAINRHLVVQKKEAQAIAQICTRLDGLPLAIELAAMRVRGISLQEILERLEVGLGILKGSTTGLPQRQQTLTATIQWSYDLLNRADKALFYRLAVFAGGGTIKAISAICDFEDQFSDPENDLLDGLERLIDQSLLVGSSQEGRSRFAMLATIHEFATRQLSASGESDQLKSKHAAFYLALAEEADRHLIGRDQPAWMRRLSLEQQNLRAALSYLTDKEPASALRLACALRRFWHYQGLLQEGLDWFSRALENYQALDVKPDSTLARALSEAGNLAWFYGDYEHSYTLQQRSVALWRDLGDKHGLALALWQLAKATWAAQGDSPAALDLVSGSAAMLRALDDRSSLANALFWHGVMAFWDRKDEQARQVLEESIELAAETEFMNILAASTSMLGRLDFRQGDLEAARIDFEESLALFREFDDLPGIAIVAQVYGELLHVMGDHVQAEAFYLEAMRLDNIMHGQAPMLLLCMLSLVLCRQKRIADARQHLPAIEGFPADRVNALDQIGCAIARSSIDSASGSESLATQLLGYAGKLIEPIGQEHLPDVLKLEYDRLSLGLAERLGHDLFTADWRRGYELDQRRFRMLFARV